MTATCPVDNKKNDKRRTLKNAVHPLTITITQKHVERAKCESEGECVIAQALADQYPDHVVFFSVGATCTKIVSPSQILRYTTPNRLKNSLQLFDKTKHWDLPPGQYTLLPYTGAKYRWDKKKKKKDAVGGKQDVFRGHPAVPTRRVTTVRQLIAA
jgi:hypothetical protein